MWWPVLNSGITTVSMSSCCTRISLRIHHNDNCTAPVSVSVTGLTGNPNAITCCADIKKPRAINSGLSNDNAIIQMAA